MSFELDEILSLSDRILVMYEGRIVAEHTPDVSEAVPGRRDDGRPERRRGVSEPRSQPGFGAKAPAVLLPVGTTLLAFAIGGLVVAPRGTTRSTAYKAIFNGTGLNYLLPWTSAEDKDFAALNLQQTLILTTPLILTALAVALPFRCGMFNIGGQGQYVVGDRRGDLGRPPLRRPLDARCT